MSKKNCMILMGQCDNKTYEELLHWSDLNYNINHAKNTLAQLLPELHDIQYAVIFPWHNACFIYQSEQSEPIAAVSDNLNIYRLSGSWNELVDIVKLNNHVTTSPYFLKPFEHYIRDTLV
jgi:hypothetical protein